MREVPERLWTSYRNSNGSMKEFIRLLEQLGYREGFNGYEIINRSERIVRVYYAAPDYYAGFSFQYE